MAGEGEAVSRLGMSELSMAVYDLLESLRNGTKPIASKQVREGGKPYRGELDAELRQVSLNIEDVMREGQRIVDWHRREDAQRIMRRDIKRELRRVGNLSEQELDDLARSMVEMARRRMT